MRDQGIGDWLEELASAAPAPGGGAAAALNAATGAALVSMVCNLTIGKPKYAAFEATMTKALARADELRREAIRLAEADAEAFAAVAEAYGLPKATDEEKRVRRAAIQRGLVTAADVPLRTAALAAEVIALSGEISPGANVNVLSDVAVAAAGAQAALRGAKINVEINLAAMTDPALRDELAAKLATHLTAIDTADEIQASVTERIG